jgi:hypothetical protein
VGSYHFYRGSLRTIANSSRLALPARPVAADQELLRSALLGLEVTIAAAYCRSARAMKPGLSFLFALFLLAAAAVPEAAASGSVALLIGQMP